MKTHLANAVRSRTRRFYTSAVTSPSTTTPFFDAGFTPVSPRLVNTAQITLQSAGPSAQQSKSSQSSQSSQPATSLALVQGQTQSVPTIGANTDPSGTSSKGFLSNTSSGNGMAFISSSTLPNPGFFFPSILHGSLDRAQSRSSFRLECGAYGIPKPRASKASQASCSSHRSTTSATSPPATPSTTIVHASHSSGTPSSSTSTYLGSLPETLDLSIQVGDDSYFIRSNALGVADGVGGWSARPNGNSALFSRRLMHHASYELSLLYPPKINGSPPPSFPFITPAAVLASLTPTIVDPDPVDILQKAYERTLELCRLDGSLGSSTALLALLISQPSNSSTSGVSSGPRLRIAHVGDCLIGIIRRNELVYRSSEQQHRFNYPFQLGPQSLTTPVKDAFRIDLPVQEGDVIVLATDGLGDNLWDEDMLEEAAKWGTDVRGLSEALAKRAKRISEIGLRDGEARLEETPFARKAAQEGGRTHVGGKQDDISVLVAVIKGVPTSAPGSPYLYPAFSA